MTFSISHSTRCWPGSPTAPVRRHLPHPAHPPTRLTGQPHAHRARRLGHIDRRDTLDHYAPPSSRKWLHSNVFTGNFAYSITAYSWQLDEQSSPGHTASGDGPLDSHTPAITAARRFSLTGLLGQNAAPVLGRWSILGESSRYLGDGLQIERAVGRTRGGAVRSQYSCHPPPAEMSCSLRRSRSGSSQWGCHFRRARLGSRFASWGPASSPAERDCVAVYLRAVRGVERSRQDMRRIDLGFAAGERHADVVHFPSPGNGSSSCLIPSGLTAPHIS